MPYKPKRPCSYPGCSLFAEVGQQYCPEHLKKANKLYNQYERDPSHNKRYGRAWKRIRDRYIKSYPLCEECERQDRLTPAEEVHHIIPLNQGGTHDRENLMSLCQSCHNKIHINEVGDRMAYR